jgi:hypothetical protein
MLAARLSLLSTFKSKIYMAFLIRSESLQYLVFKLLCMPIIYYVNHGGRNNGIFRIVVRSGFKLIILGASGAAIVTSLGAPENQALTSILSNILLIVSATIGANYIFHANMSLRDFPNKSKAPEELPKLLRVFFKTDKNK